MVLHVWVGKGLDRGQTWKISSITYWNTMSFEWDWGQFWPGQWGGCPWISKVRFSFSLNCLGHIVSIQNVHENSDGWSCYAYYIELLMTFHIMSLIAYLIHEKLSWFVHAQHMERLFYLLIYYNWATLKRYFTKHYCCFPGQYTLVTFEQQILHTCLLIVDFLVAKHIISLWPRVFSRAIYWN